jgi:DNA-binding FadR family transcriptional regulator
VWGRNLGTVIEHWRPAAPPERRPLVDQVIASLRELVGSEGLQPGDRLPSEPKLAERLQVGRSTLREAIRALSHAGVLEVRHGSGTFVARSDDADLAERIAAARVPEVFEVRTALEVLVAQVAPVRRTSAQVTELRAALADCRAHAESGDVTAFIEADSRIHRIAAEATGNTVLAELYEFLRRSIEPALVVVADLVELQRANDRHEVLIDAIESGDAAAAEAATRAHLAETMSLLVGPSD